MANICVQTELNPARHILESPCQYVRCHCLNFSGDVCFQGVYGWWFVSVNSPFQISPQEIIRRRQIGRARWPKSLRNDAVAGKGPNFGNAGVWSVGRRSILLEISNWEFLIVQSISISHTTNVLLFKFRCNIFIGARIIKEKPGSVASGTHCIILVSMCCSRPCTHHWHKWDLGPTKRNPSPHPKSTPHMLYRYSVSPCTTWRWPTLVAETCGCA